MRRMAFHPRDELCHTFRSREHHTRSFLFNIQVIVFRRNYSKPQIVHAFYRMSLYLWQMMKSRDMRRISEVLK